MADYGPGAGKGPVKYGQLGTGPIVHADDRILIDDTNHRWEATDRVGWHRQYGPVRYYRPLPCTCCDLTVLPLTMGNTPQIQEQAPRRTLVRALVFRWATQGDVR